MMLPILEVLGWDLDDAIVHMEYEGYSCSIMETAPPREVNGASRLVVVRQNCDRENHFAELTISRFKQRLE